MTLTLRDGWQACTTEHGDTYLYPPKKPTTCWSYYVDLDADMVAAFPHGGFQCRVFDTIEEAHAYLIESGSESPWEEV
jgi:hypothetical protein